MGFIKNLPSYCCNVDFKPCLFVLAHAKIDCLRSKGQKRTLAPRPCSGAIV